MKFPFKKPTLLLLGLMFLACSPPAELSLTEPVWKPLDLGKASSHEILLQGFTWTSADSGTWWRHLASRAEEIKTAGFTMIWFPPASDSLGKQGYLPRQWYKFDSAYGTAADLEAALKAFKSQSIGVIADVVVNHRVGTSDWADFTNPAFPSNPRAVCKNDEWLNGSGGMGNVDTGSGYSAGRDLDHSWLGVRIEVKAYLNRLKDMGFSGWRYDYAKGFSPAYFGEYNRDSAPYFAVGEYWPDIPGNLYYATGAGVDAHRRELEAWVDNSGDAHMKAFDFTTKWQLQLAVSSGDYSRLKTSSGKAPGLLGSRPQGAVSFLDNHDTAASGGQDLWPFGSGLEQGYAYILTHPGTPSVFWDHYAGAQSSLKTAITQLITLRKTQGIHAGSPLEILRAEKNLYVAQVGTGLIVKLGSGTWTAETGWTPGPAGPGWSTWTR